MSPLELMRFAAGALRGHRLRAGLSVAGVAIGIAAVVALTALGEGARAYVVGEFAALGSNLLIVLPGKTETTGHAPLGAAERDLTLDDYRAITQRVPLLRLAAPLAAGSETVRWGERSRAVPILGTTAEFLAVRRLRVASGRFLSPGDPDQGGAEIVLGPALARELFGAANPLGEVVRVGQWRFKVVGVLAPRGRSLGFDFDDLALVPVRTAMRMFNRSSLFRILVDCHRSDDLEAVKRDILALLKERHRAEAVTVITQDAMVAAFSSILQALTLALVGIASVSLAVAGVGIMNVMLVAVSERRSEIGLLKALGASNRQVLAVFLVEAVLLSSAGGVAGVVAGAALVQALVEVFPQFPAAPPPWAVAAALVLALAVGVLFGVWPARRATALDPVAALARR